MDGRETAETWPLEGALVRLRAFEPEDATLVHAWVHDPRTIRFLSNRYPLSLAAVRERLNGNVSFALADFAITDRQDGACIGWLSLRGATPEVRCAELGLGIGDPARWGNGYGTDAVRSACRFGFEMMQLHRIQLDVFASHERGRRLYERLGFRVEARRREASYKDGRYEDVLVMGLLGREASGVPA